MSELRFLGLLDFRICLWIAFPGTVILSEAKELSPKVAGTSFEERCFVSLNRTVACEQCVMADADIHQQDALVMMRCGGK